MFSGRVFSMGVPILLVAAVLVSLGKTLYYTCLSPPRSERVPAKAELVLLTEFIE